MRQVGNVEFHKSIYGGFLKLNELKFKFWLEIEGSKNHHNAIMIGFFMVWRL